MAFFIFYFSSQKVVFVQTSFFLRSPVNGKPKEKEKKPQKKSAGNGPKKNTQANKTSIPDVNEEDLIPQAVKAEVDDDDVSVFESDYQTEEYRDDEYSSSYEEEDVDIDGKSSLKKQHKDGHFGGFKSSKIKMKNGSDFQGDDLRLDFSNSNPDHYFDSGYDDDDPKSQEISKKDSEYDDGQPNSQDYSMELKGNLFRSGSTVNKKPLDKYERTEKSFESEDIDSEEDVSGGNGSSDGESEGVDSEEIGTDIENEILNHLGDDAKEDSEGGDSVGDDESVQSGEKDVREPRNSFEKFFQSDEAQEESESVEDTSDEGDLSSEESQSSLIISGEAEGEKIGTKGGTTVPQNNFKEIGGDQHKSSETKSEEKPDESIDSEKEKTLEDEIMNLADETGSDESLESSTNSKTGKKVSFEYSEEIDESRSEETSAELGSEELSDESRIQDESSDESGRQEHSDDDGSGKTGSGSNESVSQEGSGKSQSQETKKVELEVSHLRPSEDTSSDESEGEEESKVLEDILSESKLSTSDKSESKHSTLKEIGKDQDGSVESKTQESLDELISPKDSKEKMTLEDEIMNHFNETGQSEEKQDSDGDDIANLNRAGPPLVNRPPTAKDPDNSDDSKELSSEDDASDESRESPDRTISEGESEELGTSIESEILNHLRDDDEDSLGDNDSKEEDGVNQKTSKESESDKESRLVESLEKFFESSEPRRKHETSVESRSQEFSDESTRQISSSESGNHKGSGKIESQEDEVESSSPVCQHETLSSPSNLQWVCEERGDQEFGDSCFLRCKDENEVPDSSIVSVCTPEGWIPHPKKVVLRKKYL